MQPPRRRVPRIDFRNTATLRLLVVNATALVTTLLLVRLASLLVRGVDAAAFPRYIKHLTEPLVWPLKLFPGLSTVVARDVTVADMLLPPAIFLTGLVVAGIISGWGDMSAPGNRHLHSRP